MAVLLVLAACGGDPAPMAEEDVRPPSTEVGPGAWERVDDLPVPGRATAATVWVGGELVVVGGETTTCEDGGGCGGPTDPPLTDGAALDPATGSWRAIPDAPVPVAAAATAVAGDDAYLLADDGGPSRLEGDAFLRWSGADATWTELPRPDEAGGTWYQLVAAGEVVVAAPDGDGQDERPDRVFDPAAGTWSDLPDDPLPSGFDRQVVWSAPHLFLFATPHDGSADQLHAARLDLAAGTWEQLPDTGRQVYPPWLVDDGVLTTPSGGGADGGTYDVATGGWRDLPPLPSVGAERPPPVVAGIVGAEEAVWTSAEGVALDLGRDEWVTVPPVPGGDEGRSAGRPIVAAAGRDLVALPASGTETWIWRTP